MEQQRQEQILLLTEIEGLQESVSSKFEESVTLIKKEMYEKNPDTFQDFDITFSTPVPDLDTAELKRMLEESSIVLADPSLIAPILTVPYPNLKWIQSTWAGVNPLPGILNAFEKKPIVTRLGGVFGSCMGEYVFAHILENERKFKFFQMTQEAKTSWEVRKSYSYRALSACCIGIMGMGDIGKDIAKIADSFGMKVVGLNSTGNMPETPHLDEIYSVYDLPKFLANLDYIVNVLPSTVRTRGLLGGDMLSYAKRDAVFINVGRGDVISQDDLINVLENDWIQSAVLDVFEQEPLPLDSPLWERRDVTITPHVAAISFCDDVTSLFFSNLKCLLSGEPQNLRFVVDLSKGY
eukprot:CAMPEP_0174256846 /NCGR_PEP_ID=MMETSP0439-20130205/6037_1 /TAXON_ID=0 /ORGANISM="Stereomyxa ramosa, Strain Chinc5" /LENGTH=350 /DNA_ID=CAMNT_0015339647 /DNA_START=151 /DNA_END=1203 /DNA_ORIENTATION=-